MCGICGTVGFSDEKLLERMCGVISHRGPDDSGLYCAGNVGLGHRRLSIIDLEKGHQPIHNEDNSLWIVFNGEIYNYRDLKKELEKKGHRFYTDSDTETIVHLYEEYGRECVKRLRGMFAFALWDDKRREIFIARDRLGIKPLYYAEVDGKFLFGSEIKSLLQYTGLKPRLNEPALDRYLSFRYVPGPETCFKKIKKLQAGHFLCYREGGLRIGQYWDIHFEPDHRPSLTDFSQAFREKLEQSIKLRLMSEVPLGAYLSGGLDSSFIVALMSGLSEKAVESFSVGFAEEKYNELEYARIVADHFQTNHHTLYAEEYTGDLLDKIVWHLDEPLADAAVIPTYLMSKLTKQHVTVVLSGEGADELLAGYPKYKVLTWAAGIQHLLPGFGWNSLGAIFSGRIDLYRLLSALGSGKDRAEAYMKLVSVFSDEEKELLYTDRYKKVCRQLEPMEKFIRPYFETDEDLLSQLLRLDIKTWLPDDLLLKNDKMSMANAVEARVPYLDHELVELMARIPSKYKLKRSQDKLVLRRAMQGIVPQTICRRKKTGFTVPVGSWSAGDLKDKVAEVLNKETIGSSGFFNWSYVEHILSRDLNNQFYRRQFWSLFSFCLWHKVFFTDPE
ncbi:MAG: asparagine synthase (glutamine-hydrolyzing) [bacterium]